MDGGWSASSHTLLPCGHPCALEEEGVATVHVSLLSRRETLTYVTHNNSGYHLLRTYARLIMWVNADPHMTLQIYEIYSIFIDKGGGGGNTCCVHVRANKWQRQDSP